MMDCKQLREIMDCYVDGELSAEATASADAHLRECTACARAAARLNNLRQHVRHMVTQDQLPPGLEARVRGSLQPTWRRVWAGQRSLAARVAAAAAVLLAVGAGLGIANAARVEAALLAALDRGVLALAHPASEMLEGTILCRDCELHERYDEPLPCARIGHHGALATPDGRLWSIVEHESATDLVHNSALLGTKVRIRARVFRDASSIAVEEYQIVSREGQALAHTARSSW